VNDSTTTTVVTPTVPAVKVKTTENVPVEYIKLSPAELESLIDKVMETNKPTIITLLKTKTQKKS
jgi:hypothetical protein